MPKNVVSPHELLKARRPEKFSDSVSHEVPALDRSLLEYHLETLTSRSQENDFENFARRLAYWGIKGQVKYRGTEWRPGIKPMNRHRSDTCTERLKNQVSIFALFFDPAICAWPSYLTCPHRLFS